MSDYQPPTLAGALDAGIDLTGWPHLRLLADTSLVELRLVPPGEQSATQYARRRDAALERGDQAFAAFWQWCTELAGDGDLTERFRAAIPDQLRAECDERLAKARSPHPLTIGGGASGWSCDNCGQPFEAGHPALTVGDRPGYSELEYLIQYCGSCVRAALNTMEA